MQKTIWGILLLVLSAGSLVVAQTPAQSIPTVDCTKGQSINQTLSTLDKQASNTVLVNGTCTEYVQVTGFENLTLKGLPGAKLAQPATVPGSLLVTLLMIEASRSVTVQGLTLQADDTISAIGIGHGSTDIRLRNLTVDGGGEGIIIFEHSQVSIAYVNGKNSGYTPLGIYDASDVHVEHCLFDNPTGASWHAGIDMGGGSHITIYATTLRNMQVGISANWGSIIDIEAFNTYYALTGPTDVTIDSPAGTNYNGVNANDGALLNLGSAKLVINKAGQTWGGTTGGVLVSNGSTLNAPGGNLTITGSYGQGITALNNSHAIVGTVTVSGNSHGGLVAVNLSSIDVTVGSGLSSIGGNSVDLFCDTQSIITGSVNIAGAPTAQCTNLLATETLALP